MLFACYVKELSIRVRCTYPAENMGGEDGCAGRMQAIIRTNCEIVHLVGQGSCVFLRKKSGNFRNLSLWQPRVKDYIRNVKRVNGWTKLDIIEMFRHLFIFSLSACKVWLAPCHVSSRVPLVPSVQIF